MNGNDNQSTRRHMTTLFEFARAMRASIQNINENSYNNFITRIGMLRTDSLIIQMSALLDKFIHLTQTNLSI